MSQTNIKSLVMQASLDLDNVERSLQKLSQFEIASEFKYKQQSLLEVVSGVQIALEDLKFRLSRDEDLFLTTKFVL